VSRPDISASWSDEDWADAREDLAPSSGSEPPVGQYPAAPPEHWTWADPDGRPAAWGAFGE
jgi:hypothetical protein